MSITFDLKGKQITWFPEKKSQTFWIPLRKNAKIADKIIIDKVLENDKEYGQPYLPNFKLIAEVVNPLVINKKIVGMKYKAKKRWKKKWGHPQKFTEIKIVGIEKAE